VDFSRLNRTRVLVGGAAAAVLILSILFLPWYSLEHQVSRIPDNQSYDRDAFICGEGDFSCTAFETFPIMRWLLLAAAVAPLILGYILVRGHKLSYPPGEMTMVAGFAATVLIAYNGIIDRPGNGIASAGVGLDYGYWLALIAAMAIGFTGFTRSLESGGRRQRKAPGTV
jgi:hypothetical protein